MLAGMGGQQLCPEPIPLIFENGFGAFILGEGAEQLSDGGADGFDRLGRTQPVRRSRPTHHSSWLF
jgi:hypothetical protein